MKNRLSQFALCILSAALLLVSATSACGRKLPGTSPASSEPSSTNASASSSASFASSGSVTENPDPSPTTPSPTTPSSLPQAPSPMPSGNTSHDQEWAIYWYLCGSDLETRFEAGTEDLAEMLAVALPDGITVVIQTGGASEWAHEAIDADKLQRFVYDRDGLRLVDERPLGNMGHAEVFQDFLAYAKENHPAERVMINIWDHGGGTLAGAAFDELHGMDSLKLPEMHQAISGVFEDDKAHPPVDIIGFDACLMATVDVAATFSGLSRYLVASQEVEPGGGWDYTAIFNALAEEPETDPYELATIICDSYLRICEQTDTADIATLSVTDLSGVDDLLEAYDNFACEVLAGAVGEQKVLVDFARACSSIQCYGPNATDYGFTNMADLGQLAASLEASAPFFSPMLQAALDVVVPYRVNGPLQFNASGLSFYCPYDGSLDHLNLYAGLAADDGMTYLYRYLMTGALDAAALQYLEDRGFKYMPPGTAVQTLYDTDWEGQYVYLDEIGRMTMLLDARAQSILSSVRYRLYRRNPDFGYLEYLGDSREVLADWQNGLFHVDFKGTWGYLDGSLCLMDLMYENNDYLVYSVPIFLNGEGCYLTVFYDRYLKNFYLGDVRQELFESGAVEKNVRYLQTGDRVEPIVYMMHSDDFFSRMENLPGKAITVTPQTSFQRTTLENGDYEIRFLMEDFQRNFTYSEPFTVSLTDAGFAYGLR